MRKTFDLDFSEARAIADAIVSEAAKKNLPVVVAIADSAGELIILERMDNTPVHSIHSAINKAYTAARFRMDSGDLFLFNKKTGKSLLTWTDSRYTDATGGLAVTLNDGSVVGAIGVGGRPYGPEDLALAEKGLKVALKILPNPRKDMRSLHHSNMPVYTKWGRGDRLEFRRWSRYYKQRV